MHIRVNSWQTIEVLARFPLSFSPSDSLSLSARRFRSTSLFTMHSMYCLGLPASFNLLNQKWFVCQRLTPFDWDIWVSIECDPIRSIRIRIECIYHHPHKYSNICWLDNKFIEYYLLNDVFSTPPRKTPESKKKKIVPNKCVLPSTHTEVDAKLSTLYNEMWWL